MEQQYQMIPASKDTTIKMSIGYVLVWRKNYKYDHRFKTHIFMVNILVMLVTAHLSII